MKALLSRLSGRNDLLLALLLIAVVFMMILPMPTELVDILIAINLGIAVILMMMAIYIHTPLEFTVFPLTAIADHLVSPVAFNYYDTFDPITGGCRADCLYLW